MDEDSNEISSLRSDISGPLAGEALSASLMGISVYNVLMSKLIAIINRNRRIHRMQRPERAENEIRTRDPQLGKLMLYQLSYFRKTVCPFQKCSTIVEKDCKYRQFLNKTQQKGEILCLHPEQCPHAPEGSRVCIFFTDICYGFTD